jgi:hypothetical protein
VQKFSTKNFPGAELSECRIVRAKNGQGEELSGEELSVRKFVQRRIVWAKNCSLYLKKLSNCPTKNCSVEELSNEEHSNYFSRPKNIYCELSDEELSGEELSSEELSGNLRSQNLKILSTMVGTCHTNSGSEWGNESFVQQIST